jgi:hypothetical protein
MAFYLLGLGLLFAGARNGAVVPRWRAAAQPSPPAGEFSVTDAPDGPL